MKTLFLPFFGFNSVNEFLYSNFAGITTKLNLFTFIISVIYSFFGLAVYSDPNAIVVLLALYILNTITGLIKAIYKKEVSSEKMARSIMNPIVGTMLISLTWWMGKSIYVLSWLPLFALTTLYSTLFISIIENFSILGVLPKNLVKLLKRKIYKNIEDISNNESE